jgi:hypothetical protein
VSQAGRGLLAALALALAALAPAAAPAQDAAPSEPRVRLTGYLENDAAYRLRSPLHWQKSQARIALEGDARLLAGFSLHGAGWMLYDPIARLGGDDPELDAEPVDRWQVAGSRHLELELRELTLDWTGRVGPARVDLSVGKQQVVWGQSIGLRILDVVNPYDFREFLLDDFGDARLTLFGVDATAFVAGWTLEALAFPDYEPNRLPPQDGEFALDPRLPGFLPELQSFVAPPLVPEPFTIVRLEDERSPKDWHSRATSFGFRVARTFGGVDLALHYFDATDAQQAFVRRIDLVSLPGLGAVPVNTLTPEHVRVHTGGASFSTSFASFTLWGEGTLGFGRAFALSDLTDRDGLVRRPELQTVLGLDWTGLDPLFVNVQWIEGLVLDHDGEIELDRFRNFLTLLLRLPLRNETVVPQLFVLYGVNDHETMIRPAVEWKATDRLSFTVGADVFTGARSGIFGQYAHETRCTPVPAAFDAPGVAGCEPSFPPGRTSRAFLRVRYAFDFAK